MTKHIKTILVTAAKIKLARFKNLTVIGITGSYGKTSTKLILKQILKRKYQVPATPASYNTPMGIATVILRQLKSNHEIFIAEMGAYQKGEIKQLCRLVKPDIGVLTAIGPMHLERFDSLENIKKAKYELNEALPENGYAVLNGDDQEVAALANKTNLSKALYYCFKTVIQDTDRIEIEINGQNTQIDLKTNLLGEHQFSNLAAAAAVALHLGITTEEIKEAATRLTPPPPKLTKASAAKRQVSVITSF